jgi:hypothetical protein
MTERKPPGMSFTSWIDKQIYEAMERGAFDDLPGAGKPLPKRSEQDASQAWLRDYLAREGVPAEEMLPAPLMLRVKIQRLTDTVQNLRSEDEVREAVAELNHQIREWRRIPLGPPIFVPLVDAEAMLGKWRAGQREAGPAAPGAEADSQTIDRKPARSRWWHRARRSGGH